MRIRVALPRPILKKSVRSRGLRVPTAREVSATLAIVSAGKHVHRVSSPALVERTEDRRIQLVLRAILVVPTHAVHSRVELAREVNAVQEDGPWSILAPIEDLLREQAQRLRPPAVPAQVGRHRLGAGAGAGAGAGIGGVVGVDAPHGLGPAGHVPAQDQHRILI